jgi:hypothetical protein
MSTIGPCGEMPIRWLKDAANMRSMTKQGGQFRDIAKVSSQAYAARDLLH